MAGIDVAKKLGKYKGRRPGTLKAKPQRAVTLRDKGLIMSELQNRGSNPTDSISLPEGYGSLNEKRMTVIATRLRTLFVDLL